MDKYGQVLHPCHYLITAIKRYLLYGYAGSPGANPGPELLAKKLSFAMDILKQYDIVSPGLTKERGLTLFEVNVLSYTRGCPPVYARESHSDFEGFFVIGGSALQASEGGN